MSDLRIGIIGAGGTGKSFLSFNVSNQLGIRNLPSREVTEVILKRDNYDFEYGIQVERFLANSGRQNELLRMTLQQQNISSFVTDRTVVDLAAYAICEMNHSDPSALNSIIKACQDHMGIYTHLFVCPSNKDLPVAGNGKRTLNPWYQYLIYLTEMGILKDWGLEYTILTGDTPDERKEEIMSIVEK